MFFRSPFSSSNHAYSLGSRRPLVLRIRGSSFEEPDLGQIGEGFGSPTIVVDRVPLAGPPSPFGKGKNKVSEIRYPGGSDYLRVAMHNVEVVGPSRIEPFFGMTFAARYRPPFGVHVWCLDFLTSYIVQVPKMVCFFEVAFENNLCIPLHLCIKSILQHFNVCPSQLSISKRPGPEAHFGLGSARWALARLKPERPKLGPSQLKGGPGCGLHFRPGGLARIMAF